MKSIKPAGTNKFKPKKCKGSINCLLDCCGCMEIQIERSKSNVDDVDDMLMRDSQAS